jgi:hypothetical protein
MKKLNFDLMKKLNFDLMKKLNFDLMKFDLMIISLCKSGLKLVTQSIFLFPFKIGFFSYENHNYQTFLIKFMDGERFKAMKWFIELFS